MEITLNTTDTKDKQQPAWVPTPHAIETARVTDFMTWLERELGLHLADYDALWRWSVDNVDAFWCALWDWAEIASPTSRGSALVNARMPGATWFPGVRMN